MIAAAFATALLLSGNGAFAATSAREISLTTYLRDGPGVRYRAVDEAEMGTLVSVIGCADGWCDVFYGGVSGYVAQSTLAVPSDNAALKNPVCAMGPEASYHGSRDVLFCHSGVPSNGKPAAANP